MDVSQLVQTVAIYALPVLFAITLHEAAHGYVARHFGDMTAFAQGRISLDPLRHVELMGTMIVPALLLLATGGKFAFGWAKPVPVNYSALRKPRLHMALVAAAGPVANLVMLLVWAAVLRAGVELPAGPAAEFLLRLAMAGVVVNLVIMAFNLLPILPLDGGRILVGILPAPMATVFGRTEALGSYFFMAFAVFGIYDTTVNDGRFIAGLFQPLNQLAFELLRAIASS
ncbi:MAG: site-2 protease family protein [Betaproteobacteria bacterium]|nr:site-2 protease family protein [Betaproteobacteria bacterium]